MAHGIYGFTLYKASGFGPFGGLEWSLYFCQEDQISQCHTVPSVV